MLRVKSQHPRGHRDCEGGGVHARGGGDLLVLRTRPAAGEEKPGREAPRSVAHQQGGHHGARLVRGGGGPGQRRDPGRHALQGALDGALAPLGAAGGRRHEGGRRKGERLRDPARARGLVGALPHVPHWEDLLERGQEAAPVVVLQTRGHPTADHPLRQGAEPPPDPDLVGDLQGALLGRGRLGHAPRVDPADLEADPGVAVLAVGRRRRPGLQLEDVALGWRFSARVALRQQEVVLLEAPVLAPQERGPAVRHQELHAPVPQGQPVGAPLREEVHRQRRLPKPRHN